MKRMIGMTFVLALLLALCFGAARAEIVASGNCGTDEGGANATWTLSDTGELVITGTGEIGYGGWDKDSVLTVTVGEGITGLYTSTFRLQTNITTISLPNTLESIGFGAFKQCYSVEYLTIPESVNSLGREVFAFMQSLKSIQLPSRVESWDTYWAFISCDALESVTMPEGVTDIGEGAFLEDSVLTSVTLPSTLKTIGLNAFGACSSLSEIVIPEGVTVIDYIAFNHTGLTHITLPTTLKSIGTMAFNNCNALKSLIIPEGVTSIIVGSGEYFLTECESLEYLYLPGSLGTISKALQVYNNSIGLPNLKRLVIGEGATSIGDEAIVNVSALENLTLPSTLTSIGGHAFHNCTGLKTINFPSTVTTIGEQAFAGCTGLGAVTLPENLQDIKAGAFQGCTSLTLPNGIPDRTNHIYEDAFNGCTSLTSITFPDVNGSLMIYDHAFENCTSLTDVVFTGYIMKIGSGVFEGCSNLTNVTFQQDGMKTDGGDSMFSGCASLTSLRVPLFTDRGKIVPNNFCNGCSALTTVWLNADLTAVGDGAFQGCSALTDVYFRGTAEQWSAVSIGENNDGLGRATIHYAEYIPFGTVIIQPSEHGTVTASKMQPAFHSSIHLEATPDEGYQLARLAVMNPDGEEIALRRLVENQYLFYHNYRFVTVISEFEPVTAGHGTEESPYLISGDHCPMMLYTGWYKVVGSVTAQVTLVIRGDVHLILDDGATLNATNGVNVPEGNTLTISGSGALNAKPQPLGSGIGAGYLENGGTVIIDGGTIKAAGTSGSAGIGGALGNGTIIGGPGGTIIINGGYVTATADPYAAGIGGNQANGATVIINGGVIHATGGPQAAAIGSGAYAGETGATSSVTIADGLKVTAAGADAPALCADRLDACAENSEVWVAPCGHDGEIVLSPAGETSCAHCGVVASFPDFGTGTASDPWKIGTAGRWNTFASAIENGLDTSGKHFRLTDSISVTTMIGTGDHPFCGHFDGGGHTLNVSLTASSGAKGAFAHVSGASFAHLRVAGTITTAVADTGGLVGHSTGCTITDCVSDIHIVANGGNGHAGFVGSFSGDMAITGSVYTGSIVGTNASYCAGFAGSGGGTVDDSIYDGLIDGKANNNTFLRQKDRAGNCYYTNIDGIDRVKGKQAIAVTADEGVTIDFGTPKATYPTSGITAYNTGLMYNEVFYAGPNETVTLGLSGASSYIVIVGTLTKTDGVWTLTMPPEDVVIMVAPVFGPATFTLPAALTTIEESAFEGMTAMTIVDASHCTSIGKWAFKGCSGLTQIRLPRNCAIDPDTFDGCGTVYVFAPAGGTTETYCQSNDNPCMFVEETQN